MVLNMKGKNKRFTICIICALMLAAWFGRGLDGWRCVPCSQLPAITNGAFPLHGTVRFGTVRLSLRFHCSLVPLYSGRDYSRVVITAPPLLP